MKKIVVRFRAINKDTFRAIHDGVKTVETRAATSKYKSILAGDVLVFVCGADRFERMIECVQYFADIPAMLAVIPIERIMPGLKALTEAEKVYHSFPGYKEKIKQFGIVAFELASI
jgi:ASC-1-like (ASCH) protein